MQQWKKSFPEFGNVFLPYDKADKIIEEVMKNGRDSREAVMLMLLEHASETKKATDNFLSALKNELGNKQG
jgi:hypothetical protein